MGVDAGCFSVPSLDVVGGFPVFRGQEHLTGLTVLDDFSH